MIERTENQRNLVIDEISITELRATLKELLHDHITLFTNEKNHNDPILLVACDLFLEALSSKKIVLLFSQEFIQQEKLLLVRSMSNKIKKVIYYFGPETLHNAVQNFGTFNRELLTIILNYYYLQQLDINIKITQERLAVYTQPHKTKFISTFNSNLIMDTIEKIQFNQIFTTPTVKEHIRQLVDLYINNQLLFTDSIDEKNISLHYDSEKKCIYCGIPTGFVTLWKYESIIYEQNMVRTFVMCQIFSEKPEYYLKDLQQLVMDTEMTTNLEPNIISSKILN